MVEIQNLVSNVVVLLVGSGFAYMGYALAGRGELSVVEGKPRKPGFALLSGVLFCVSGTIIVLTTLVLVFWRSPTGPEPAQRGVVVLGELIMETNELRIWFIEAGSEDRLKKQLSTLPADQFKRREDTTSNGDPTLEPKKSDSAWIRPAAWRERGLTSVLPYVAERGVAPTRPHSDPRVGDPRW